MTRRLPSNVAPGAALSVAAKAESKHARRCSARGSPRHPHEPDKPEGDRAGGWQPQPKALPTTGVGSIAPLAGSYSATVSEPDEAARARQAPRGADCRRRAG